MPLVHVGQVRDTKAPMVGGQSPLALVHRVSVSYL